MLPRTFWPAVRLLVRLVLADWVYHCSPLLLPVRRGDGSPQDNSVRFGISG